MGVFDPCSGQLVVNETADQRRTYSRVGPSGQQILYRMAARQTLRLPYPVRGTFRPAQQLERRDPSDQTRLVLTLSFRIGS